MKPVLNPYFMQGDEKSSKRTAGGLTAASDFTNLAPRSSPVTLQNADLAQ